MSLWSLLCKDTVLISDVYKRQAAAIQRKFIPKVNALFSVPSPAPVKAVLNHLGFEVGPLRLPLVACTSEEAKRIIKVVLEEDVEATRETVTGVVDVYKRQSEMRSRFLNRKEARKSSWLI